MARPLPLSCLCSRRSVPDVNDAKACAVTGGTLVLAMLFIIGMIWGWLAVFFACLAGFGFLMFCVGVDRVNELLKEETPA